jgi:hypothetical protein
MARTSASFIVLIRGTSSAVLMLLSALFWVASFKLMR